ncbi:MAG: ATP synthase F1 subunit delta [Clostridiales bacterium]|nr:ATP synthase F1 subunit delta [Clostridiales bacterium]
MATNYMIHLHALSLLEYAERKGLTDVYQRIWALSRSGRVQAENAHTEELKELLQAVPEEDLENVLKHFLDIARGKMESLPVEIISAVPLSREQLYKIQVNLIRNLRKQLSVTTTVDPSLLGGIRIIVENAVIDHSVKRRLSDMKEAIYEGVYQIRE